VLTPEEGDAATTLVALLAQVLHDLFADQPAAADDDDFLAVFLCFC